MSETGEIILYVTYIGGVRKTAENCKQLLQWFDTFKIKYTKVDLGMCPEKRAEMEQKSGLKTLPQVFVDENYIGGFDEISDWVENEQLLEALQQAGANVVVKN